jgi:hypothetical protein
MLTRADAYLTSAESIANDVHGYAQTQANLTASDVASSAAAVRTYAVDTAEEIPFDRRQGHPGLGRRLKPTANQKLRLGKFGNRKSERRSRQGTSTPPVKRAHGSQIFGSFSRITHARQIFGEFSRVLPGRAVSPMFYRGFLQRRRGCPAAPRVPASLFFSVPPVCLRPQKTAPARRTDRPWSETTSACLGPNHLRKCPQVQ